MKAHIKNFKGFINEAYRPNVDTMDEAELKSELYGMGVTPVVVRSILSNEGIKGLRKEVKKRKAKD